MPQPFKRRIARSDTADAADSPPKRADVSGVFQLNARVPADLLSRVRGSRIHLPLAGSVVAVRAAKGGSS